MLDECYFTKETRVQSILPMMTVHTVPSSIPPIMVSISE